MSIKHEDFNLIAFNSSQTLGRQRFTLARELYHLFFDEGASMVICPKDVRRYGEVERTADSFASFLLLPYHALRRELRKRGLEKGGVTDEDHLLAAVVGIEQKFGISRMALLVRLEDEGVVNRSQKEMLSRNVKTAARRLGYPTALYEPRRGSNAKMADGDYLDRICLLFERGLISQGRAQELLTDGFRDDIWVETFEEDELVD